VLKLDAEIDSKLRKSAIQRTTLRLASYMHEAHNTRCCALRENGIISESDVRRSAKPVKSAKPASEQNKYARLKAIRINPITTEVYERITGETVVYPSTYKTRRAIGMSSSYMKDGKTWRNRYEVTII